MNKRFLFKLLINSECMRDRSISKRQTISYLTVNNILKDGEVNLKV